MTITPVSPCCRQGLAFGEVGVQGLSPQHPLLTGLPRKGPGDPEGLRRVGRLEGLSKSMWLNKAHSHTAQSERGAQGPLPSVLRSVPRHGQWPHPTHWSLAIVIAPCLVHLKPEDQRVAGDGCGQRGHRQPLLLIDTTVSVCLSIRFSLLLHVRSGLGYPAMPLSCLPSWAPGPRVSTQTQASLGRWLHCHPRQMGTRDQWT